MKKIEEHKYMNICPLNYQSAWATSEKKESLWVISHERIVQKLISPVL